MYRRFRGVNAFWHEEGSVTEVPESGKAVQLYCTSLLTMDLPLEECDAVIVEVISPIQLFTTLEQSRQVKDYWTNIES